MELGQRLKQARLESGLSQRQLCGEEITRNMLSQIENGSARPSMQTLGYLAGRLGKPISYFLEEDAIRSPNQQQMFRARDAYGRGDFQGALKALLDYRAPDEIFDPERYLLESLCLMALAQKAGEEGKHPYAQSLLEKAKAAGGQTQYYIPAMEREWLLLLSLTQEEAAALSRQLPTDRREQSLRARAALEEGQFARCAAILDGMPGEDPQWHFLRGEAARNMGQPALAAEHYLSAESTFPMPCAQGLEWCYRELGDYKNAYFYACKQRE